MNLPDRIRVSPAIVERFPGFRATVVYALDINNGPGSAQSREWLRAGAERGMARLAGRQPKEDQSIANWREAYSAFGAKPSAYPCSAEALIQRALKGGAESLPSINMLVDAYNSVSLSQLMPVGGEDLDRIAGIAELRLANPDDCRADAEDPANAPRVGEVIWADDLGWTCRRWNWRQGARTRLTESTRNAFFLFEAMASNSWEPDMAAAIDELRARLAGFMRPGSLHVRHLVVAPGGNGK